MYYRNSQKLNMSATDILADEASAFQWIKIYFACGLKSCLWDNLHSNDHTIHSISTFLLGIRLHKLFGVEECYKSKWLYYWFLICLYHDAGYNVEHNQVNYPLSMTLVELSKKLYVSENSLNNLLNTLPTCESDTIRIDRNIVEKYYDYCRNKSNKPFLNHGIVSGVLLFERLTSYLHFILRGNQSAVVMKRQFSQSDEDKFKTIAESIIHHHIWVKTDKEEFEEYKQAGLDSLCLDQGYRLWYANPLTNLLLFCDSIEPLKNEQLSSKLKAKDILDNIYVTHSIQHKTITIMVSPQNEALVEWFNYINSQKLQSWLSVDVRKDMFNRTNVITYQLTK